MSNNSNEDTHYRFTFLRHGEFVGNAAGYYQGQHDYELNETGRAQARALAERWKQEAVCFDAIITSPLLRAAQTAEIIAQTLGVEPSADPIWMERDNGKSIRTDIRAGSAGAAASVNSSTPFRQSALPEKASGSSTSAPGGPCRV